MSKKVLFSAVALVAFSFAGMANNEVKEEKVENNFQVLKENMDCFDYAIGALWAYEELLGPIDDAHGATIMNDAMADCWEQNGGSF